MKKRVLLLILAIVLCLSGLAQASLIHIGSAKYDDGLNIGSYKLIYDEDQSLVWLDYTNDKNTWLNQDNWATGLGGQLTVNLNPAYTTTIDWSTGWQLPATDESKADLTGPWGTDVGSGNGFGWGGPDGSGNHDYYYGYNMLNSQMGHLFYESLGNKGYYAIDGTNPQADWDLINNGPFDNLLAFSYYWSGTEYSLSTNDAWGFRSLYGYQRNYDKDLNCYALAVRPGQVSAAPIPEPTSILLLGSGLTVLGVFRKKVRRRHE